MIKRKTAIIYESFYDAISDLDDADFVVMMKAYCNYALNGEPPELKGILLSMWKLILPIIDKNNQLYENGSKGGRPKNQPKTNQEPNQNQTKTKNNQTPKTPKPTPSNDEDVDVDEDVDEDKDLDKDLSISAEAINRKERENFLKVLLFDKNLQDPAKELSRFEAHYQKTDWIDANSNPIRNRLAALKAWTPDKDATRLSLPSVQSWLSIYECMEGDRLPMVEYFRGIAREGDTLHIMADNKALVEFLESNLGTLREVVDRTFGKGLRVNYRVKN